MVVIKNKGLANLNCFPKLFVENLLSYIFFSSFILSIIICSLFFPNPFAKFIKIAFSLKVSLFSLTKSTVYRKTCHSTITPKCFGHKHQIPILKFLVISSRGSKPRTFRFSIFNTYVLTLPVESPFRYCTVYRNLAETASNQFFKLLA